MSPPLLAGAVKLIESCSSPGVTESIVGASGTVLGLPLDEVDAVPLPAALTARTLTL